MPMRRREMFASVTGLLSFFGWSSAQQASAPRRQQTPLSAPPRPKDDRERRILTVLDEMQAQGRTYLSVPPQDGRWLRVLAESTGAKHIVEIGTSTGYSGMWFL